MLNEKSSGSVASEYSQALEELKSRNLYRQCRRISGAQGPEVIVDGRRVILLCSNNYLGLADHPALARAASKAASSFGFGAGASRLVSGTMDLHCELEERLAKFKRAERCLLFNSGYHANIGVLSSLASENDVIYSDALNHASIIDGVRLSRATARIYPHLDVTALEKMMRTETVKGRKIIVTDGVFSMDGDVAPLDELVKLKRRYDALLVVDEAHATGVVGPGGRGLAAEFGLDHEVDISVGTLGKALGSFGAFAAGRSEMIEWLINTARSFIFTTALPPPVVAASIAALDVMEREPERIEALKKNARYVRRRMVEIGFDLRENGIPIIPLIIGDSAKAVNFAAELFEEGIFCQAIRPPSVPAGSSRLRITVMATHTRAHLDRAVDAISKVIERLGIIPDEVAGNSAHKKSG